MDEASIAAITIGTLNELAEMTGRGFVTFDDFVDDPEAFEGHVVYDSADGSIACDTIVDELHSDIVSRYEIPGADVRVMLDDDNGEPFIECDFEDGVSAVIEAGRWYLSQRSKRVPKCGQNRSSSGASPITVRIAPSRVHGTIPLTLRGCRPDAASYDESGKPKDVPANRALRPVTVPSRKTALAEAFGMDIDHICFGGSYARPDGMGCSVRPDAVLAGEARHGGGLLACSRIRASCACGHGVKFRGHNAPLRNM